MRALRAPGRRRITYVDAKIVGIQEKQTPRRAFVGFVVEGREDLAGAREVQASETDEAEEDAVLFAVTKIEGPHHKVDCRLRS